MITPFLSVLLDPRGAPADDVRTTVTSLLAQTDPGWELLVAGPAGEVTAEDARVRSGGLVDATGEFVAHVEAGGWLEERAVAALRTAIEDSPEIDLAYCHERRPDMVGGFVQVRKPVWSPARLRSQPWTGLTFLRRDLTVAVAAEDHPTVGRHDLVLRVAERARAVVGVAEFLWTGPMTAGRGEFWDDVVSAVQAHLTRTGTPARASEGVVAGTCRLDWSLPAELTVAAVIPIDGGRGLAWGVQRRHALEAVRALVRHAGHPVRVVVVHTPDVPPAVLDELWTIVGPDLALVPFGAAFDWAAMVNRGVLETEADAVIVLEQECEIVTPDFVADLVGPLQDETVGLAGPRLVRADSTLVNAGLAWFQGRVVAAFEGVPDASPSPEDVLDVARECTALSGECLAMRRATFDEVGGVSESLPGLAAIDLSLKVARAGRRRLWIPHAKVFHLAAEPGREDQGADAALIELRRRWPSPDIDDHLPHLGARQAELAASRLAALMD